MFKKIVLGLVALSLIVSCTNKDATLNKDSSNIQNESYALGSMIGKQIGNDFSDIDYDLFLAGFKHGFSKAEGLLTDKEVIDVLTAARTRIQQKSKQDAKAASTKNSEAGKVFLAKNKKEKGVTTTKSGLQYKVITAGKGKAIVKAKDKIKVHYKGTLLDGTVFDSSYDRGQPAEFSLDGLIPGWQEALKLMPVGAKWKLFVPANLAYGERQVGKIEPNQTLVFEIELLDVNGKFSKKKSKKKDTMKKAAKKK